MTFPQQNLITADYPGSRKAQSFTPSIIVPDELIIPVRRFGIVPDPGVDNTQAFNDLATWIMQGNTGFNPYNRQLVLFFEPGEYLIDGVVFNLVYKGVAGTTYTPRFTLKGSGAEVTVIKNKSNASSPVLFTILAGVIAQVNLEDLTIRASSSIRQDALAIVATRRTLDNVGGITDSSFNRITIWSPLGDALVTVGGQDALGPNQGIGITNSIISSTAGTSWKSYGQLGQVASRLVAYSSQNAAASYNPQIILAADNRQTIAPSAVDTVNNYFTMSNQDLPIGTPVRIIGANLPSGLSTGVTYYLRKLGLDGNTIFYLDKYALYTTPANLISDTRIALGTTGTLGNWYICPLYATSVTQDTINFEFPHNLCDGGEVNFIGGSLPTGVALATSYFVIRKSATSIGLASTKNNAFAGTAISFSGGTVTAFGLHKVTNTTGAYSVKFDTSSVENAILGLYVSFCNDIQCTFHIETLKNSIYVHHSNLAIIGGHYADPASDSGKGCVLAITGGTSRVSIDGSPSLLGVWDNILYNNFGGLLIKNSFVNNGASISTPKSIGTTVNYAAADTLDVAYYDWLFVSASATVINTITSKHGPKTQIKIMAFGGTVTLGSAGNIKFNGASIIIPDKGVVILELVDTVAVWAVVGKSF